MKKLVLAACFCLLALGYAQHNFECTGLDEWGRGELGPAPPWAIPYCTGTAEEYEARVAKNLDYNYLFMQSYEALVDNYGAEQVAQDVYFAMQSAGYEVALNEASDEGVSVSVYTNENDISSYIVYLLRKEIDFYFLLVKTDGVPTQ